MPGFVASPSNDELTQRKEIFVEIQKAYGYLTNPLTKVIYDEFGVTGLSVYEKSKIKFQDLQEEMRTLSGAQNEDDSRLD